MAGGGSSIQGLRLGRYVLGERIAHGGMGEVFLAHRTGPAEFQKQVALKLLLPHLNDDPAAVRMFLDEARLVARLNHRHIVQVFDVGAEEGRYYLAMELVHGVNLSGLLRSVLARGERLSAEALCLIGRATCDALHGAHELRGEDGRPLELVHRDVSPQNILVSVDGEVKLTDFGIAKARDSLNHTRSGVIKGKYEYLAPEQFRGGPVDRRTDVFAMGVTLFHLATGVSPFRRDSEPATMLAILEGPLPALTPLRPELPPEFKSALEIATRKERERRFPTARALGEALPPPQDENACRQELGRLVQRALHEQHHAADGARTAMSEPPGTWTESLVLSLDQELETSTGPTRSERRKPPSALREHRPAIVGGALGLLLLVAGVVSTLLPSASPAKVEEAPLAVPLAGASAAPSPAPSPGDTSPVGEPEAAGRKEAEGELAPAVAAEPVGTAPLPSPSASRSVASRSARGKAATPGYLSADATPWAQVRVNGKLVGETPLYRLTIPAGSARVELFCPATGRRVTRALRIEAGKEARVKEDLR